VEKEEDLRVVGITAAGMKPVIRVRRGVILKQPYRR
jgi:hypothetical protein